ncbi:autotransporter assembly complex family protein [Xenophilus aerolatus]|nr:BamA/TamA family outer membrane protein [Xenophilus aerolatus]
MAGPPATQCTRLGVLLLAVLLGGCSLLPWQRGQAQDDAPSALSTAGGSSTDGQARTGFSVTVEGPDEVRELLEKHLELQRYRQLDDLGVAELSRLMVAAEANARELLGTLGYFTPLLVLQLCDTPDAKTPHDVLVRVDPGPRTRVVQTQVDFAGPIVNDAAADAQREAIRSGWSLGPGRNFTQQDWDNAKTLGLRALTAKRFPTGNVQTSRADVDADTATARLAVTYQSGPAYRFGPLDVRGAERYGVVGPSRIARLPTGKPYDQQALLDAQQRLASSGYYDSVFLTLDTTAGNPDFAPVIAQVREAQMQKVVLGVGFTTDSGPRVSVDHIYNQMPLLGWRAVSRLSIERDTKLLNTTWTGIPGEDGWKWGSLAQLKREQSGTYDVDSGRLRYGRSQSEGHIDRALFLQYDYAVPSGSDLPATVEPAASAVSANWNWTGRYFDDNANPRRGWGLALELGAGYTLSGQRLPFTRAYGRWMGVIPLGSVPDGDTAAAARQSRIALRAELGAITAKEAARIPSTLRFLTGGDTTVRGYAYQQIGTVDASGATVAGRYLAVASAEWQKPIVWNGQLTPFESAVFVDAGNVADKASDLSKPKVGVGAGVRWRSPVGPLQADVAYGVDVKKFRLHLRLGVTF